LKQGEPDNQGQIQELYDYLDVTFAEDTFRLNLIREKNIVNRPFPSSIQTQELKTPEGTYVTWGDVLSPGKIKYVDFWASWCGPCRAEMPAEKELISEFGNKGIEFILVSIDTEEDKWINAMDKINVEGKHYILKENFKSELIKYLKFNSIPRYLIIDKNNSLLSLDAPRPGEILNNGSVFTSFLK
jgi:thiol-disulfide isomerase/thioredoxin